MGKATKGGRVLIPTSLRLTLLRREGYVKDNGELLAPIDLTIYLGAGSWGRGAVWDVDLVWGRREPLLSGSIRGSLLLCALPATHDVMPVERVHILVCAILHVVGCIMRVAFDDVFDDFLDGAYDTHIEGDSHKAMTS